MHLQTIIELLYLICFAFIATTAAHSSFTTVCPNGIVLSNELDTGGICYNISNDKANWNEANANCTSNGGRLARILNDEISNEIQKIITDNYGTENYWIGLKRVVNTEQFQWTDGTDLTYNKWSNNNPILEYNCVGVNGNSINWISIYCNDSNHYICETDVCNDWTVRNGICYKKFEHMEMGMGMSNNKKNWNEAETLCEGENAYLAEIPNIYVNNIITDEIIEGKECWIGLRTNETNYYWRIGNFPLSDPNTTPTLESNDRNRCGIIGRGMEDRWNLRNCNDNRDYTICMKGPLTIEAPTEICTGVTSDTIIDRGYCYRRIKRRAKNLDIAYLTCNSYNGALYTFNDARVNMILYSNMGDIKVHEPDEYDIVASQNGYFNLLTSDVYFPSKFNCRQLGADGNLNDEISDCGSSEVNYICKIGQSSFTTVCPNGIVLSNGSDTGGICYNISNDKANWNEANTNCISNGGRLARILNSTIANEIQRVINNTDGTENYWIGLQRVGNTEQFQWTDGTDLTYNKWSNNNPLLGYNCVGVNGSIWFSLNCIDSYFYICETDVCNGWRVRNGICYKKFEEEPSINWNGAETLCTDNNAYLAEIPNIYVNNRIRRLIGGDECWIGLRTNETDYYWRIGNFPLSDPNTVISQDNTDMCGTIGVNTGNRWGLKDCSILLSCAVCMKGPLTIEYPIFRCLNTNDVSITVHRGICYRRIVRRANELDLASLGCHRLNGELYRFDDNEPNRTLIDIFNSKFSSSRYPILVSQFVPRDGYFNLLTSNENLTIPTMCHRLSSSGELVQADCGDNKISYLCKIEYDPYENIQQNVSTNDSCYWSVSGNRNWTEADTQCITEGGHLVEIFDENTQNIIVSLIATDDQYLDELYWIGIEYVNSSQWRSGANVTYSNFSSDTAITDLDLRCVAIDKDGSWIIMDCNNKYSFVCGKTTTQSTTQSTTTTTTQEPSQSSVATNAQNNGAKNCDNMAEDNSTCGRIYIILREDRRDKSNLQGKEDALRNLLNKINVTIGGIIEYRSPDLESDLVIIGYNRSQNTDINIGRTKLNINKGSFASDTIVIVANYTTTGSSSNAYAQILRNDSRVVVSDLITIVASNILIGELTIAFTVNRTEDEGENFTCTSLNSDGKWVSTGIRTVVKANIIECITSHLTTFAVLVTITSSQTSPEDTEIQAYISVILCSLSLFALLITVLLYFCIGKKFYEEDINIIQLNYVLSLIFALISFLILTIPYFAKITFSPAICTTVTLLNHYTWLSVFCWSFCQAIHIVFALFSNKLPFKRHYPLMLAIGWGLPLPIVIVTLGLGLGVATTAEKSGYYYELNNICFLTIENGYIWALLGPIYLIILINLVILFLVIGISIYVQRKRQNQASYLCRLIIGIGTTIPLLGIPWILGVLPNIAGLTGKTELAWFSYIFIIFNASQGIIFFVAHVIRNTQVRALCTSSEKAGIDNEPHDEQQNQQREENEGRLRGTEGRYTCRREVAPIYFTESTQDNVVYVNQHIYT